MPKLSLLTNIVLLLLLIFFVGTIWTRPQVAEDSGQLAILIDPIASFFGSDSVILEDPVTHKRSSFFIPSHQSEEALKKCSEVKSDNPAIAKVVYQKNLWEGQSNPMLVITQCGNIGLHK